MSEEKGFYSAGGTSEISKAIAERTIAYRPSLKSVTKSTNGAILIQQIAWYWYSNKERPFYKFIQPCEHSNYREGDSWCEELNFTYSEFTTALAKFAAKVEGGMKKTELEKQYAVIYWTDADRVTWWQFNHKPFEKLYKVELLGNSENSNYLENEEKSNYFNSINTQNTKEYFKGKKKGDLVDGMIAYGKQAVEQKADKVEEVIQTLERGLKVNITRNPKNQSVAKRLLNDARPIERFLQWVHADEWRAAHTYLYAELEKVWRDFPQAFPAVATEPTEQKGSFYG